MQDVSTPPTEPGASPGRSEQRVIAERYRLDAVLGRGAMGIVWAGYDELLHRPVAVKEVLAPNGMPADEASELRERTLREARANAGLAHPNVITVYDVVRQDDEPFVVMELFPSTSLAALVRHQGPLDVAQAAAACDAVAAALEVAHRAGITHRDVKPGNVLVSEDGQIKLSDFGIARNVKDSTITGTGLMLGTPAYISPEVAAGGPAQPAADLWGLGATLYALVEGRPPYDAGDPLGTVTEVVQGAVPKAEHAGPLGPIIAGLMTKTPADRMPLSTVRAHAQALQPRSATSFNLADLPTLSYRALTMDHAPGAGTAVADAVPPEAGAPLASEPGPLPFTPTAQRRRRRWPRVLALAVAAVLGFAVAASGGFVVARVAAGQPPLPRHPIGELTVPPSPREPLVPHEEQASTGAATDRTGGHFSISYPTDWTSFHEQRGTDANGRPALPAGAVLRYVSPNGDRELFVERFENFYPALRIKDFEKRLTSIPNARPRVITQSTHPNGTEVEGQHDLLYRSEEHSALVPSAAPNSDQDLLRSHFLRLVPRGRDLWVVQLTTDTNLEVAGQAEFDDISGTFFAH